MFDQKDKEFLQELISPLVMDICEIKVEMKAMRRDIDALKADVEELKTDMKDVKQRLSVVEADVAELKTDVTELKTDVAELRTDVDDLQRDMEQLNMCVHRTNIILENDIPRQIGFIADGHKFLEDKMDMIININDEHKLLMVRVNVLEGAFKRHCDVTSCETI